MKIRHIACAALLAVGLTSCDKFLDLKPISEETSGNAYNTAAQLEAALTGSYESFQSSDYYVWDRVLFQDVRSDNAYAGGDNPEIFAIDYLNITPVNGRVYGIWSNLYNAIAKANLVLEKTPLVQDHKLSEQRRSQIVGEALFLRAYHYFTLVRVFGGVPLMLEPVKSTDPSATQKPRNSEQEVYAQIATDLQEAIKHLPDTYGADAAVNRSRATKGAANALLAKVYAQQPTPDYGKVVQHADAVINSPAGYRLLANYAHLFDGNHYANEESILEIQFLGGVEGSWAPQMQLPPSLSGDTWRKFVTPSHDLINAYDALGDAQRKGASVLFEEVPWVDEFWNNQLGSSVPFAYKWKNASGWNSADKPYLLRLADILLIKAEALNAQGNSEEAAKLVDQVRQRVGLAKVAAADRTSKTVMADIILQERRLELAFEGHRWDDLVRHGKAVQTMNALNEIDLRTGSKVNYQAADKHLRCPLPQRELDRNPKLQQNPGY